MTETQADFAIVGSTPLARLVAGLLASVHGKSVVFVGESQSGYRLPRGVDLSLGPVTRPQTWALLKATVPETLRLLTRIGGRSAWSRIDPLLFSETEAGKEAIAHIRHMALAFGHAAEPVGAATIGAGRDGLVLRDAVLLHRPVLETGLDRWLDQTGVQRQHDGDTLEVRVDGSARLVAGETSIEIRQTVLADDVALLDHLVPMQWPDLLVRQMSSTMVTEPTRTIAAQVMLQLDSDLMLVQRPGRGITAMGPGQIDPFSATLGDMLGRQREFRQAQSSYQRVITRDAAPAVGRIGGTGADVVAGFGPIGAFLAPAIARWLSGVANADENAWFGARLVDRHGASATVAEVGGVQ